LFFKKLIFNTPFLIFLISVGFFGLSILTDRIIEIGNFKGGMSLEDGSKFLGIVCWTVYFTHFAFGTLKHSERAR
jgi:hypothetical protein